MTKNKHNSRKKLCYVKITGPLEVAPCSPTLTHKHCIEFLDLLDPDALLELKLHQLHNVGIYANYYKITESLIPYKNDGGGSK